MSDPGETFSDRAWYAWHCLPRDDEGSPPSPRPWGKTHGVDPSAIGRLFKGERGMGVDVTRKFAEGLGVSLDWLVSGKGEAPVLTGPLPPRRKKTKDEHWQQRHRPHLLRAQERLRGIPDDAVDAAWRAAPAFPRDLATETWVAILLDLAEPARQESLAPAASGVQPIPDVVIPKPGRKARVAR